MGRREKDPDQIANVVGATLRQLRRAAGLDLVTMARRTSYGKDSLSNAELGTPSPAVIRAYERVLDLPAGEILLRAEALREERASRARSA